MYSVSNDFLAAFNEPVQQWKIRGYIGTTSFTGNNILTGSCHMGCSCSDSGDIKLGAANIGTFSATFIGLNIPRTGYKGKTITVEVGLVITPDTIEWVPAKSYTIAEADWTKTGVVVQAYDTMQKFDKPFEMTALVRDYPYNILSFCCQECGVIFGMTDLYGFCNADHQIGAALDATDIETYRDVLYWIAQTLGAFCTIDRNGRLVLRRFVSDSVATIDPTKRYNSSSFSDYVTHYTGLSVVIDGKTLYYGAEVDNGSTINLGANPFMAYDDELIYGLLNEIQQIAFTPFTSEMLGGIHFDLGDTITEAGGLGDGASCLITQYDYTFNKSYRVSGAGQNPTLASAKSKTDKTITGIIRNQSQDETVFYLLTNTSAIFVDDGEKVPFIDMRFTANKNTVVVFHAEIQLDVETTVDGKNYYDAVGEVEYTLNDEILDYSPTETWEDGKHLLHLLYYFKIDSPGIRHFIAKLEMNGGSALLAMGDMKAAIYGQNLAASDDWGGILRPTDTVEPAILYEIGVMQLNDACTVSTDEPIPISYIESIPRVTLYEIGMQQQIADTASAITHTDSYPVLTETGDLVLTETGDVVYTEGE
jgi:hypothetical protein